MLTLLIVLSVLLALFAVWWFYWRFVFFFRDPDRIVPPGKNVVAPADGIIVYTNIVEDGYLPITVKEGKKIHLNEITKADLPLGKLCHIGIFMDFFNVHVNRTPIDGKVAFINHFAHEHNKNYTMNWMGGRRFLRLSPLYKNAIQIWENERNTIRINGDFPVYVVQIADAYVNKIFCWVKVHEKVEKGQRYGRVAMGSQVDLIFPFIDGMQLMVKEWDKVKAGETIIATY